MARTEIYIKDYCPYCHRATALLDQKGVEYDLYDVTHDPAQQEEMKARAKAHTVPQIFIDDKSIGGCDELFALDRKGELDKMLGLA